jgi:starch phosphorylase
MAQDGAKDLAQSAAALAMRLPRGLGVLARLAFNYRWSWLPGGDDLFRRLDPLRWEQCGENPVRLLQEVSPLRLQRLAADPVAMERAHAIARAVDADLGRPAAVAPVTPEQPLAFFCAEYGVHRSLPIYAGGLGVLAGDFLKEASDRALPVVGVGLFYAQGYLHQRLDPSGWQHEYWIDADPERLPAALVSGPDGRPLTVKVSIFAREVHAHIWRVDVGRIPLFLLDTNLAENSPIDRWITARLYVGDRQVRLAQYALLGIGGLRALRALGIDPGVLHLNEGHAGLAALELVREHVAAGLPFGEAIEAARRRVVFTTHTPVPAGNEVFAEGALRQVLGDLPAEIGSDWPRLLALGRIRQDDAGEPFGMTPLALRTSRAANGVSRRHGEVARAMWSALWPERAVEAVPIGHVTNGVHLATWMAPAIRDLLDRYLGPGWEDTAANPATWAAVEQIPAAELWAVRCRLREDLVGFVRERSVINRLARGESLEYAQLAARLLDPHTLTIGFARRGATYKRLYLLASDLNRAARMLNASPAVQVLVSGTAHPADDEAKRSIQQFFAGKNLPNLAGRVAYLDDYNMAIARRLIWGCDVWINLPRPPFEASGTSGMKSALNGGLQLSVLDGWWAEAYDGGNGWAIPAVEGLSPAEQDAHDAAAYYDLTEFEVMPLFYERNAEGIPLGWVERIKASLRTNGPRFNATRMVHEYMARVSPVA